MSKLWLIVYMLISAFVALNFDNTVPFYYRFLLSLLSIYATKKITTSLVGLLGSIVSNFFRVAMFASYIAILAYAIAEFSSMKNKFNTANVWKSFESLNLKL